MTRARARTGLATSAALLAAAAVVGLPSTAHAATSSVGYLEGLGQPGPGQLTGLVTQSLDNPAQYTQVNGSQVQAVGLDFDQTAQKLFAIRRETTSPTAATFGTLDPSTNGFTAIGDAPAPTGQLFTGLTVDPWTGTTYASTRPNDGTLASRVVHLDPATGARVGTAAEAEKPVLIGNAATDLVSISTSCAGETYGVNSDDGRLYKIDPATGVATSVGPLGVQPAPQTGLDFDNATGVLYLWSNNSFGTVNTTTGAFTAKPGGPGGQFEAAIRSACPRPTAQITSGPTLAGGHRPTFGFATANGTVDCSFDQGTPAWHPCTTATSDTPAFTLKDGAWNFRVRTTFRGTPVVASQAFTVDTTAPSTRIVSPAEGGVYRSGVPTQFASNDPKATFRCSIDGGSFAACVSGDPLVLPDGTHSLSVKAVDAAKNVDQTTAVASFRIDTQAPDTAIVGGPAAGSRIRTAAPRFSFTTTETGSAFQCSVDGARFVPCSSPFALNLPDGHHRFQVASVDRAGNVDPTPASRGFRVDTVAPRTSITSGPANHARIHRHHVRFVFHSNERATFRCRLDGKKLRSCTSPKKLRHLGTGRHVFTVKAVDRVGLRDHTPARRVFFVRR